MAFWQWSKVSGNNGNIDASINMSEGMPPAQLNDGGRAIMARMAEYRDDVSGFLLTAGTSIAYTVATNQGLAATPNDGQLLVVSLHVLNGAAATLSVDGGAAFPLQFNPGNAVAAGTLPANVPFPIKFRAASSSWILLGAGVASIADSVLAGSVTNAGLANMAASTFKGNPTLGSAAPIDFTIDSLTNKPNPVAADEVPIWDAGVGMKKALLSSLAAAIGAAPTVQTFLSGSALTYTPTAGMVRIRVRMVAGSGGDNGTGGGNSLFGGWGTVGGQASSGSSGGIGGTGGATGTGALIMRVAGVNGGAGSNNSSFSANGGAGGNSPFGGAGAGGALSTGTVASANTGSGGGGRGYQPGVTGISNGGGGAGEYVEFWMTAAQVGASQGYTVGTAGSVGGAAGRIIVEEFYI